MHIVLLFFSTNPVMNTANQFAIICVFDWHVFTEGRSEFILKNYFSPDFLILTLIPLHKRSSKNPPKPPFPHLNANPVQSTFHMHIDTLQ